MTAEPRKTRSRIDADGVKVVEVAGVRRGVWLLALALLLVGAAGLLALRLALRRGSRPRPGDAPVEPVVAAAPSAPPCRRAPSRRGARIRSGARRARRRLRRRRDAEAPPEVAPLPEFPDEPGEGPVGHRALPAARNRSAQAGDPGAGGLRAARGLRPSLSGDRRRREPARDPDVPSRLRVARRERRRDRAAGGPHRPAGDGAARHADPRCSSFPPSPGRVRTPPPDRSAASARSHSRSRPPPRARSRSRSTTRVAWPWVLLGWVGLVPWLAALDRARIAARRARDRLALQRGSSCSQSFPGSRAGSRPTPGFRCRSPSGCWCSGRRCCSRSWWSSRGRASWRRGRRGDAGAARGARGGAALRRRRVGLAQAARRHHRPRALRLAADPTGGRPGGRARPHVRAAAGERVRAGGGPRAREHARPLRARLARARAPAASAAAILLALTGYGALRLAQLAARAGPPSRCSPPASCRPTSAATASSPASWEPTTPRARFSTRTSISRSRRSRRPASICWSGPRRCIRPPSGRPRPTRAQRSTARSPASSRAPACRSSSEPTTSTREDEFNAAVFLEPGRDGRFEFETYRKAWLFPLTERVPRWLDGERVRAWLPWLGTWKPGTGSQVTPLALPDGRRLTVAPLICYDAVTPGLAIAAVRAGAELIVTLSNDAWFATGEGPHLHLVVSAFRSLETRRSQVRATNTGISAVISPTGELLGGGRRARARGARRARAGGAALRNPDARVGGLVRPGRAGGGPRAAGDGMADADSLASEARASEARSEPQASGVHSGRPKASEVHRDRDDWSAARFVPGERAGHYESWFQRANHPTRPLAFWIRYTIFCPRGRPEDAVGELWAIAFDGEAERISAVKQALPISECRFSASRARACGSGRRSSRAPGLAGAAAIGRAPASAGSSRSAAASGRCCCFRARWYARRLPSAKALVATPGALFDGCARDRRRAPRRSTAGAAARITTGEAATPIATPGDRSRASTAPRTPSWSARPRACGSARSGLPGSRCWCCAWTDASWRSTACWARCAPTPASTASPGASTHELRACACAAGSRRRPAAFVALRYGNPPGGEKICLNSKLARCELTLEEAGQPLRRLRTANRAAFEILTDESVAEVPIVA